MTDPSQGAARQRNSARITRLVLLVIVVIGVFAAWQVVQREFLPRTYVIELLVVGDDIGDTIYAKDILEHFEVVVDVPGQPDAPIRLGDAGARADLTLNGSKRYGPVRDTGVQAALVARQASAQPLRLELGRFAPGPDGKGIVVELTPGDEARLRRERVRAAFEVRDETGRPVTGLRSNTAALGDRGDGRYQLDVDFDQVLIELHLEDSLQVRVEGAENLRSLVVDPRWFLGEPVEPRVIDVDLGRALRVVIPVVEGVTPRRVARSARGGNLVVSGEDLLLVANARLVRGSTKLPLRPIRQREGSIEFELPNGLSNGKWDLELDVDGADDPVRVGDAVEVYTEFRLDAPAPLAEFAYGAPIEVLWSAAGAAGTVSLEIESVSDGVRWPVYEGSVGKEAARFPQLGSSVDEAPLAPGAYRLRLQLPRELGGELITRDFTVLEPPAVEVIVQLTRNGRPFTAYDEIQIDGLSVEFPDLRNTFKAHLAAGRHELAVKVNSTWQRTQFESSGAAGELIVVPLDR